MGAELFLEDTGSFTYARPHLSRRIAQGRGTITVLCAPRGYGKTTAARDWARAFPGSVEWLDTRAMHGVATKCGALEALPDGVSPTMPRLLIGDGVRLDDVLLQALRSHQHLFDSGALSVLIAIDDPLDPSVERCRQVRVLGASQLRLQNAEAVSLGRSLGSERPDMWLLGLNEECRGHVGLFTEAIALDDGISPARVVVGEALPDFLNATWWTLSHATRLAATVLALLRGGRLDDASAVAAVDAQRIKEAAAALPAVVAINQVAGTFSTHEALWSFVTDVARDDTLECCLRVAPLVSKRAEEQGRPDLSIRVASEYLSGKELLDSINRNGRAALNAGCHAAVHAAVERLGKHDLVSSPQLLLLSAEASRGVGRTDEALARSRAAICTSRHASDRDTEAGAEILEVQLLHEMGRHAEARCRGRAMSVACGESLPFAVRMSFSAMSCASLLCEGRFDEARIEHRVLVDAVAAKHAGEIPPLRAISAAALVPCAADGDLASMAAMLGAWLNRASGSDSDRIIAASNLGVACLELGRLERAFGLLSRWGSDDAVFGLEQGSYQPMLGCLRVAAGDVAAGVEDIARGVAASCFHGDEAAAAMNRVYQATVLRAAGRIDESLIAAERAFEYLGVEDSMHFRRLACLEVAASLLALGDLAAARAWAEPVVDEGFDGNRYHAFRAALVLAEADRLQGDVTAGAARLAEHADYIRSENANWQTAMYARTFPSLLGMAAAAVGPEALPSHMLRMILPEHAEACLAAARELLAEEEWRSLGTRLLGTTGFAEYVDRDGLPLCHVRLLGGFEVNIGGVAVRDKDWRKNKARLLFAMLAASRGHEVPRDQLLDRLWPDLDPDRAKNNLYVTWSTMKAALMGGSAARECPYVESARGVCRVVRANVRTDLDEFEDAVAEAKRADASGRYADAISAFQRAADAYRGELLPSELYEDWFTELREEYRARFCSAMLRLSDLLIEAGDPAEGLLFVRRAQQAEPLREDIGRAVLRAQIASGQRSGAIETFFLLRTKLADELGLDPEPETLALYDRILAMEERPAPVGDLATGW